MRRFLSDFGAMLHRNPHIGITEGRRIVKTIANHSDDIAGPAQLLNDFCFICRQHVGILPGQSEINRSRTGNRGIIAGQHDGVAHTHGAERFYNRGALRPDLIRIGNETGKNPVDSNVQTGIAALIKGSPVVRNGVYPDVALPKKALAADMEVVSVYLSLDAESDAELGFLT